MLFKTEFLQRLKHIIKSSLFDQVKKTFSGQMPLSVRINTLRTDTADLKLRLDHLKIEYRTLVGFPNALIIKDLTPRDLDFTGLLSEGRLYIQSLSSMLPVLLLDPQPGDRVLDLCAAPGSKASQIAALMKNQGELVCIEAIRGRYYKLKSVLSRLGVSNARVVIMDGRRFRDRDLFERILVDAPCSSEGRFKTYDKKTQAFWSLRKIKEMARKQKGLLLNAARLLKKGGILVYSTCTFAPEENEAVVDWLLRKTEGQLEILPAAYPGIRTYPALTAWEGRNFDPRVSRCLRVLPTDEMEGFFIAQFTKKMKV